MTLRTILATLAAVAIVGIAANAFVPRVHASQHAIGDKPGTILHGQVADRESSELLVHGSKVKTKPDAVGWREHLVPMGAVTMTWPDGRQETVQGAGARPCDMGCVSLYTEAMRRSQAAAKAADAGPDPDKGGVEWIDSLAACTHACESSCDVTWPAVGQ